MKLFQDRLLVRPEKQEEITQNGIILTGSLKPNALPTGIVIELGETVSTIKVGDKVLFNQHDGSPHEDMVILREAAIIGVL